MLSRLVRSRPAIAILTAIATAALVGGVAWAITPTAPSPTDRFYVCVQSSGAVETGTMTFNTPPAKCHNTTDTIRSWSGPTNGPVVSSVTFTVTSSGCPSDQYRLLVRQVGLQLSWSAFPSPTCLPINPADPEVNVPPRLILQIEAPTSQLPSGAETATASTGEMPVRLNRIGSAVYAPSCNGGLREGTTSSAESVLSVQCLIPNPTLSGETDAQANARFAAAAAAGITSGALVITQQ